MWFAIPSSQWTCTIYLLPVSRRTETYFNVSVWFACFPPDEPHVCHLLLNRSLAGLPVRRAKGKASIAVPLKMARLADERRDLMAAVLGAISLR